MFFLGVRGRGKEEREKWGGGKSTVLHQSLFVKWQKEKEKEDNMTR